MTKRHLFQATDGKWYFSEKTHFGFRHTKLDDQNTISTRDDAERIMHRMVRARARTRKAA
jgi:hypothetical protein